jgi:hypothetical protein
MAQMTRGRKYAVAEIKGGELEKERIETRQKKEAARKEKRDRYIDTSFENIKRADEKFVHRIS